LKNYFEGLLIKGIDVEFNEEDEFEEVMDDDGEMVT
jgi:hypothetical protein